MKYSKEAVLRHPAYRHGFEGHRALKDARIKQRTSSPEGKFDTTTPSAYRDNLERLFEDSSLSPYHIWIAGAHAGMGNSNTSYWAEGATNPEPIYDEPKKQRQLQLL